jgi:hypothetical protein
MIRRLSPRLRSKSQLRHFPSGYGKGRWQDLDTFWRSKMKGRRLRNIAEESRKRNWGTR